MTVAPGGPAGRIAARVFNVMVYYYTTTRVKGFAAARRSRKEKGRFDDG
jgi:hypothetical protein